MTVDRSVFFLTYEELQKLNETWDWGSHYMDYTELYDFGDDTDKYKIDHLNELYNTKYAKNCIEDLKELYHKIYPNGVGYTSTWNDIERAINNKPNGYVYFISE